MYPLAALGLGYISFHDADRPPPPTLGPYTMHDRRTFFFFLILYLPLQVHIVDKCARIWGFWVGKEP